MQFIDSGWGVTAPQWLYFQRPGVYIRRGGIWGRDPARTGSNKKADTKDLNVPPPVYGPPQVIFRIDDNRYFTLENYTHCENGQTFYNNKAKNIHVKILDASGYLFKGRLFWLSTRDDFLAFPATLNTRHASCMGSNKGCMNAVIVTTDGGKRRSGVPYGSYTQNPTGATRDYDMLVMNDDFLPA
ncbi:hypothetical protein OH693_13040 [Escherichia coli]|nr:hypothetical protein [Escherichia coli]